MNDQDTISNLMTNLADLTEQVVRLQKDNSELGFALKAAQDGACRRENILKHRDVQILKLTEQLDDANFKLGNLAK